jgi:DNA-binding phage protein
MQEIKVRKAIRFFGNITNMANKIGVSRTSIYRYLEGNPIPTDIAFRIEEKSGRKISYKELISWKAKYNLELDTFPGSLIELPFTKIITPQEVSCFPDQEDLPISNQRAICVSEINYLIYGLEAIESAKKQGKKSVLAWRVSLEDFQNGRYEIHHLKKAFDLFERTAIGIALKKNLGERRGRNNVGNFPTFKGIKTRNIVAQLLGFRHEKNFLYLKKILEHKDRELIRSVRNKKLSIAHAIKLIEINCHESQRRELKL